MEILELTDRKKYLSIQISASDAKFRYCKFSYADAEKYLKIINDHKNFRNKNPEKLGPILSLGVRNGREVDLFRIFAYSSKWFKRVIRFLERRKWGMRSRLPFLEGFNRSDFSTIDDLSSIGVELNPLATRQDIWIGSFDEIPEDWYQKFEIVYTNAFDHSFDPLKTIEIWKKLLVPGGYMIFCFPQDQTPGEIDPIGDVSMEDVLNFFPGELIYNCYRGSAWKYSEYIIKMP
jgi:hypothetical protein